MIDPADNRFRINPKLLPLIDAYQESQRLDSRTTALNSMVIRAAEAVRAEKPATTRPAQGQG